MRNLCTALLLFGLFACAKKTEDSIPTDADTAVSTGVGMMSSGIGADNSSGTITAQAFGFSPAQVTACSSYAAADTCSAGTKSATYTSCQIGATASTYSGTVTLSYSRAACTLLLANDTLTRTVDLSRTNSVSGITVESKSDSHTDYRGTAVSGGAKITKTTGGYDFEILGMYKLGTRNGTPLFNVSLATTAPFVYTTSGTTKTLTSGTLEVVHNLAQYVATFTPSNLVYDSSLCCYPSSGSLLVTYSGSISGTGSVTFGTCGTATLTLGSASQTVTLAGCE